MEVMDAIRTLRSVRKYLDVPVEMGKISVVLEAGRLSMSAGNLQNWRFILVREPDKRKEMADACLQQYWMERAPVHIVIVSDTKRVTDFYGVRGERLYAVQNCAIAMENMMLAAHDLGLGVCWVGAFDEGVVSRIIAIPETSRPQAILTLGYPDEIPKEQIKYRIENVAYIEKYGNRIGDMGTVLWEYRLGERGMKYAQQIASGVEAATTKAGESFFDKLKAKGKELQEGMKKKEEKK